MSLLNQTHTEVTNDPAASHAVKSAEINGILYNDGEVWADTEQLEAWRKKREALGYNPLDDDRGRTFVS